MNRESQKIQTKFSESKDNSVRALTINFCDFGLLVENSAHQSKSKLTLSEIILAWTKFRASVFHFPGGFGKN